LETDERAKQRLETQIAIIEVMGCVGSYSQVQLTRFSEGMLLPSLLLYLLAFHSPVRLRAAAAHALSMLLSSPHASNSQTLVSKVLPPFLVEGLCNAAVGAPPGGAGLRTAAGAAGAAGRGGGRWCSQGGSTEERGLVEKAAEEWANVAPSVSALLHSIDRDVCDARHEWTADLRGKVVEALTRAVRRGGYKDGQMEYLQRLSQVSCEGYILHRLNKLASEGRDLSLEVEGVDAARLFSACVGGVVRAKEGNWVASGLQRDMPYHMVCTIAELARAGVITRHLWSQNAEALVQSLLSLMIECLRQNESLRGGRGGGDSGAVSGGAEGQWGEGGLRVWLHMLLRAAAPAVSCDAAAHLLAHPSMVRVLVEAAVEGAKEGGIMGEEVLAGSLHVLASAMLLSVNTQHGTPLLLLCACTC